MKYTKNSITRRDLIKRFGITAFMLHPVLSSMSWAAGSEISKAPRLITVFKGGGFVPDSYYPTDINSLAGKVIEPLKDVSKDIILFKNLNMGNGDYKDEEGRHYGDEHGGGMNICFTGGRVYGYNPNNGDSYYWGTYDMSVDQRVAQFTVRCWCDFNRSRTNFYFS
jgi:prepilin-type processing-associated H-X9-DG protein